MTNIVRFDPFAELQALQKQFFGEDWFGSPKTMQLPTTDIYTEDDKQMVVEAHLPYFNEKDIAIDVDKGALVIQAERHEKEEDKTKKYVVRESNSSFYRRIRLPDRADEDNIHADMKDGILKVTVPLRELPAPKRVSINAKAK